ncbi:MAG TPA: L-threonine 3-dehydrogenase [Anaeromyxobacter sp.]|nr:L-threonine 3-dehydrogenase [Anaeromyxobacter sp.]
MKALLKSRRAEGISFVDDVPEPEVGVHDVLIRIARTAICGTDVHIYNWDAWSQRTIPVPMVIGHEYLGRVERVGAEVEAFSPGERVSGEGHVTCGFCRNCRAGRRHLCRHAIGVGVNRPGAFAELLSIPADNVYRIPDDIPDDVAAVLDPFGNAAHTALSFDLVGEDVLVTGAGPIGIMAAAIARHVGARHVVVTDVNDYRLDLAKRLGASRVVNVAREDLRAVMGELGMREGFDVGMEMSGNGKAFRQLLEVMNHGGKVALLGIMPGEEAIDWGQVVFKGLVLKGIYGREMYETWYKMIAMVQGGLDLAPVITHRFKAAEFQRGFDIMRSGQSGKVILDWESV